MTQSAGAELPEALLATTRAEYVPGLSGRLPMRPLNGIRPCPAGSDRRVSLPIPTVRLQLFARARRSARLGARQR